MRSKAKSVSCDFVVNSQKYAEIQSAINSMKTRQSTILILQGKSGCGKRMALRRGLTESGIDKVDVSDEVGSSRIISSFARHCQLSHSSISKPAVFVIYNAAVVLNPDDVNALVSWLHSSPDLGRFLGVVLTLDEGPMADDMLVRAVVQPGVSFRGCEGKFAVLVKMRPLADTAIKKLLVHLGFEATEDILFSAAGDARAAISMAGLQSTRSSSLSSRKRQRVTENSSPGTFSSGRSSGDYHDPPPTVSCTGKDEDLSFFHALGRALYAKESFRPFSFISYSAFSDNPGGFTAAFLENAPDFSSDICSFSRFSESVALSDALTCRLPDRDKKRAELVLFAWSAESPFVSPKKGFRELRRARTIYKTIEVNKSAIKKIEVIVSGRRQTLDVFWYVDAMLRISSGRFPPLPSFVLATVHAVSNFKEVTNLGDFSQVVKREEDLAPVFDEIEDVY